MDENKVIEFPIEDSNMLDISEIFGEDMPIGSEEILALLSMEDEQFEIISEVVLMELNKALNNPTDRRMLEASLAESGVDIAELPSIQEEFNQTIDNMEVEGLSDKKKDFLKRIMSLIVNAYLDISGTSRKIVNIPIELDEGAKAPTYAHDGDAAMDIYAMGDYDINPGETVAIRTGIRVAIPLGYALLIQPRSGQSKKTKLRIPNTPGLIDSGYRDEICVLMENTEPWIKELGDGESTKDKFNGVLYGAGYHIDNGQRIAQMRLVEVPTINWVEVDDIRTIEGDRGGGFGSTGTM